MSIIERKYTVSVKNVGASNLITNKGILSLFEDIACVHSDIAGYGINQMNVTHLSWILLNWKVKVFKRAIYNSTVILKTWSRNANKHLTYRDFEMYDEEGFLLCIASSKWTLVNTQTNLLEKLTSDIINCYEPEDKQNVFNEIDIPKLKEPELLKNLESIYTFNVQRRDIDMNYHMHNLYYLDYSLEALPQQVYDGFDCNEFEIMYKNGAKLGDKINCFYCKNEDGYFVVMKNALDNKLHCIINFK